jgi:hypothetical protein
MQPQSVRPNQCWVRFSPVPSPLENSSRPTNRSAAIAEFDSPGKIPVLPIHPLTTLLRMPPPTWCLLAPPESPRAGTDADDY